MEPPISIDDLVRTTDDAAVRRRFDDRNLRSLFVILWIFLAVTLGQTSAAMAKKEYLSGVFAVAAFALSAVLLLAVNGIRRSRRGQGAVRLPALSALVERHVAATAISFVAATFLLIVLYSHDSRGWIGWATALPFFMLGFRMVVMEFVILHGYLVGASLIAMFVLQSQRTGEIVSVIVVNAFCFAIEQFSSRSLRKQTIASWTERRLQARDQIRMRQELLYAREMQMSMLPECAPTVEWLDWCGASIPATEVGGDYYDYFVDDGRVAIVSSDVAGHGLASGLVLAALRSGFTLLRDSLDDPAAVLTRLHDLVAQTSRRRLLATAAVLLIDRRNRRATLASAGHPPILRMRDGAVESIEIFAPPLGVRLPITIPQTTLDIRTGDTFIVHSDGIYETRNAAGEYYGLERLASTVTSQPSDTDATQLRNAIIEDVHRFRGAAPQDDDVTIVVARVV